MRSSSRTLALTACAALLGAASALAQTQTWQIDPAHTRASFTVRHLGISNVRGDFNAVSGTAEYDGKDVTKAKINATIDVNSVTTRVQQRGYRVPGARVLRKTMQEKHWRPVERAGRSLLLPQPLLPRAERDPV